MTEMPVVNNPRSRVPTFTIHFPFGFPCNFGVWLQPERFPPTATESLKHSQTTSHALHDLFVLEYSHSKKVCPGRPGLSFSTRWHQPGLHIEKVSPEQSSPLHIEFSAGCYARSETMMEVDRKLEVLTPSAMRNTSRFPTGTQRLTNPIRPSFQGLMLSDS